ncbi:hypothetical protein [Stenotrophomonas sp. YAU14D1_LEIMI4_1]|uniref:hypothetical protein n=1 Tax=Stenotrophomonas sp. YAU14D1_LEIMI4_1 TaxID=2072407 RepID=UPI00131F2943|nr:hypothetical protein [Stenotrophomonas sp. YAU14D1_LEIMI4_1]
MTLTLIQATILKAIQRRMVISPVERGWAIGEGFAEGTSSDGVKLTSAGRCALAEFA